MLSCFSKRQGGCGALLGRRVRVFNGCCRQAVVLCGRWACRRTHLDEADTQTLGVRLSLDRGSGGPCVRDGGVLLGWRRFGDLAFRFVGQEAGPYRANELTKNLPHSAPQVRQHFVREPWVLLQPDVVPRARVRQRQTRRSVLPPVPYGCREALGWRIQVPARCVLTDDEGELYACEQREQLRTPGVRALRTRRKVSGASAAGIAKPHGEDGDPAGVVEGASRDPHPIAEPVATRIVEGDAALVDAEPGRLTCDQDAGGGVSLENRAHSVLQHSFAEPAVTYVPEERVEIIGGHRIDHTSGVSFVAARTDPLLQNAVLFAGILLLATRVVT